MLLLLSLRSKYRAFNNELGQTGAGLRKEDVTSGSNISNKIGTVVYRVAYQKTNSEFTRGTREGIPILVPPPWILAHTSKC